MMKTPFLNLTTKIVILVSCMGMACALIAVYAIWHMQRIEHSYHRLLQHQGQAAYTLSQIREHAAQASGLVYSVLTSGSVEKMHRTRQQLRNLYQRQDTALQSLYPILPGEELPIDIVRMQALHTFASADRALHASIAAHEKYALQLVNVDFTPSLDKLHADISYLRDQSLELFQRASTQIADDTQRTGRLNLLTVALGLLAICALTASVATRHISRPIQRLTQAIQSMSVRDYSIRIRDKDRSDEIGTMARTFESVNTSLQRSQQLEKKLIRQQQKNLLVEQLQDLTSALPGAVFQVLWRFGQPMTLKFASPQWVNLMGLNPEITTDVNTHDCEQALRTHARAALEQANMHFNHSALTLTPVDFEVSIEMADGVTRWIKTRANPKLETDGSVTFNGVWLDATREVVQSRALEKAKRQAEQIAYEKSTLQASISHEIRTPLNAILGLTQLLLKSPLSPSQNEQMRNVLRAGQHLRGIVNEVLDFSKIDAGQLQLETTDFSLHDVLHDVVSMCKEDAHAKGLELQHRIDPQVPDGLRGDPHRIAQILLNYVNNAIKFTTTGHIQVHLRLDPSSTLHRIVLHASVKDTGLGIPAERLPQIFEAYQQADNTITRRFGGTGLGLTISRALAQLMGGAVGVQSQLGQGSTFWFTAVLEPARTSVSSANAAASSAPQNQHWQNKRILVVDDQPLNRSVAEGMLLAMGIQAEMAEDGEQALHLLREKGPDYYDCVLMDIQMPNMDGLSATKALRRMPRFAHLPVIAMTAHTGVQDMERAHEAGMNAHLSKPLLEPALHACLQQQLQAAVAESPLPLAVSEALPAPDNTGDVPAVFDAEPVRQLQQLFSEEKLQQLVAQFASDTLARVTHMHKLASTLDWSGLRAEAHKLSGTAATFGLLRLGHYSGGLSVVLKAEDATQSLTLIHAIARSATEGVEQLHRHCAPAFEHA